MKKIILRVSKQVMALMVVVALLFAMDAGQVFAGGNGDKKSAQADLAEAAYHLAVAKKGGSASTRQACQHAFDQALKAAQQAGVSTDDINAILKKHGIPEIKEDPPKNPSPSPTTQAGKPGGGGGGGGGGSDSGGPLATEGTLQGVQGATGATASNTAEIVRKLESVINNTKATAESVQYLEKLKEGERALSKKLAELYQSGGKGKAYSEVISKRRDNLTNTTRLHLTGTRPLKFNPSTGKIEGDSSRYIGNMWVSPEGTIATALQAPRMLRVVGSAEIDSQIKYEWEQKKKTADTVRHIRMFRDSLSLTVLPNGPLVGLIDGGHAILARKRDELAKFIEGAMDSKALMVVGENHVVRAMSSLDPYFEELGGGIDFGLLEGAQHYHPLVGDIPDSVNIDSSIHAILSSGFSEVPVGQDRNPYKNFGYHVALGLQEMVRQGKLAIGDIPNQTQLSEAMGLNAGLASSWRAKIQALDGRSFLKGRGGKMVTRDDVENANSIDPNSSPMVHSIGLFIDEEKRLMQRFDMAKTRLMENHLQYTTQKVTYEYTVEILKALHEMEKAVSGIIAEIQGPRTAKVGDTTSQGIIPQLFTYIRDLHQQIETHQRSLSQTSRTMDRLKAERHAEIVDIMSELTSARRTLTSRQNNINSAEKGFLESYRQRTRPSNR